MSKLDNKKFVVCCANGSGSSLMMKMSLQKVISKVGAKGTSIHHCSLAEGKSSAQNFDVVFCSQNFLDLFKDAIANGTVVIGLKNVISQPEMEQGLKAADLID